MIADDNFDNYFIIKTMIDSAKYVVLRAENGEEALEIYRNNPDIAIIFMDINMPVMNGKEALDKIRLESKSVPVIAITAYSLSEARSKVLNRGFTDYLAKPVFRDSFVKILEKYVSFQK